MAPRERDEVAESSGFRGFGGPRVKAGSYAAYESLGVAALLN